MRYGGVSPAFWTSFADVMYSPILGKKNVADVGKTSVDEQCASCGRNKRAGGGGLLNYVRCVKVKYCSGRC